MSSWISNITSANWIDIGSAISDHLVNSTDAISSYPIITTLTLGIIASFATYRYFLQNETHQGLPFSKQIHREGLKNHVQELQNSTRARMRALMAESASRRTHNKQNLTLDESLPPGHLQCMPRKAIAEKFSNTDETQLPADRGTSIPSDATPPKESEPKYIEYSYRVPCTETTQFGYQILNGKHLIVKEMRPADFELSWNLLLANEINKYAREHILQSSTYPARGSLLKSLDVSSISQPEWNTYQRTINTLIENMRTEVQQRTVLYSPAFYQETAEKAKIEQMGNCGEMAILGGYFPDRGDAQTTLCYFAPGDHAFLAVGNVFCDPWSGAVIPKDRRDLLKNYVSGLSINGFPEVSDADHRDIVELFDFPPNT